MNQPEFPTVCRGYDPVSVDQHVRARRQAAEVIAVVLRRFKQRVRV